MMDESDISPPVSEPQKIKALQLVVRADGYLAQRQLLKALNLYKGSAEILPDPAIIRKIKKLRKYMKRNDMDLGENKENVTENKSFVKQVSPHTTATAKSNADKTLREHANLGISSDRFTKDDSKLSKIIPDKVPVIKSESPCVEKLGAVAEKLGAAAEIKDVKMVSGFSNSVTADNDENEAEHKRHIRHQKLRLSSSELSPKTPLDKSNRRTSLSKKPTADNKISLKSDEPIESFKDLRKRMYPHQKEGMKWLARLFGGRKGGILGDDMGLGKTLQVIGYLCKMFEVNEIEHVLIVLPTALVLPWQSEIKRWAPNLNFALFHGKTKAGRMKLLHNLQRQGGLLLTTYGLIVTNYEELSKGPDGREFIWDYVFLDEGHKIKNPTKTQKAAHYIPAQNRIIITGTPIQNNLMELWSLFDFVHHGCLLGTIKTFKINYENPITRARQKDASLEEKQLGYRMSKNLQKIIAPYFLRRTKAELMADPNSGLPQLPRKNDIIVWVKLTADQKRVYESYLKLDEVKELMHSSRSPLVALNILKKLCDHLRLLSMRICKALGMLSASESSKYAQDGLSHLDDPNEVPEWTRQAGAEEQVNPSKASKETDCAATQLTGIPDSLLYKESSKLMVVIELLGYLSATGHKCLVFSQSAKMLDIIQQILGNLRYKHIRMDGSITSLEQRAEIIRKFETDKDIHIFLLTTQVGGVGLNLTVADRIIIVDPSWNPAIDSQAVDRVYRIGQNKNVIIFRLITCGSVEEKIYIRQLFKLSINRQTTKESKDPFRYFTGQDLKQLFIVDDLSVSETQMQLAHMHSSKRKSDEVVDDQIKFLESMDSVFGVSDHDLVFSTEDADQEIKMTNERLQTMVEKAEEQIRNEINEESRANTKKFVPGIRERSSSVESWTNQPRRSFDSPLLNMYADEDDGFGSSGSREMRHRRSNTDPHSISPTSDEVIVLNDDEPASASHVNNKNKNNDDNHAADDDVIILSDAPSDVNDDDNSEVVMDSEDEQSADLKCTFSTFNKPKNDKAAAAAAEVCEPLSTKTTTTTTKDFDTPRNNNPSKPLNPNLTLANMTLMQAAANSPLSPRKAELKNVLVVDSPDNFAKSMSSGSQHLSDSLSPGSSTKFTVAESDYESDESFKTDAAVLESQDEEDAEKSTKCVEASVVAEDDSREFRSPAFRDVSVVVPDSSPRAGTQPAATEDEMASPLSTEQFARSEETDKEHVASDVHSLTEQLQGNLSIDNSIIMGSVRRNKRKAMILSSSESESEDEEPRSVSRSFIGAGNSNAKGDVSLQEKDNCSDAAEDEHRSVSGSFISVGNSNVKGDPSPEDDNDSGNAGDEHHSVSGSFVCAGDSNSKEALSPGDDKDFGNADSSITSTGSSASRKGRKRPNPLSSDSDSSAEEEEEEVKQSASSFSYSDDLRNRLQSRETRKPKRFILSSDDEDDDDDVRVVGSEAVDNSVVVTEELNISVNPSEPLIHCIKTPPAKVARSYFSGRKKSLPSLSFEDPCSPSTKSGLTLKSRHGERAEKDMESDDSEDDDDSSVEEEEEEEEVEGESLGDEDTEDEDSEDDDDYFDDDDDDDIELPMSSPSKTDLYNQHINASRKAYVAEDYVTALKQALQALQQDSSDIKLQMYTLSLRKLTTKK